jgi:hypothetical protein
VAASITIVAIISKVLEPLSSALELFMVDLDPGINYILPDV